MKKRLDPTSRPLGSRRGFLRTTAATALLGGCGIGDLTNSSGALTGDGSNDDPEATPEAPLTHFPLGLACGDVTASSALLWTRYAGTQPLVLAVWRMDGETYQRVLLTEVAPVEGFVHLDVIDLQPGTRHRYAFFEKAGEALVSRSPIGRFRSAPASDVLDRVVFGAVACTNNGRSMQTLERAGDRSDLDLFCLLGDTTYNDGSSTRSQFRSRWAGNLSTAGYRRVRASTSLLSTWDDHEVTNNWNPETIDQTLLATATASFFEHLPIRREAQVPNRIYRKLSWGRTADFFVLDSRSERRPSTRNGPNAQYLSPAQMTWLKQGLASSSAVFKVILNSVPVTNFPGLLDFVANDRWEGYPAARNDILSHVDNAGITGVLWVAGDFHLASSGRVSPSGVGRNAIEVLAGPGAQVANPLWVTLIGNPQFDTLTPTNNYTRIALDPGARSAAVSFHDRNDEVVAARTYQL
jgi:alkaline phosphatase D